MIYETHAHYDDSKFDEDRDLVLRGLYEKGVETVVNVGASIGGCKASLELAEAYPFIYAALGVHPDEVGALDKETFAWLEEQCRHEKVVAVGEIGLDYYWDNEAREIQKKWFIKQLELARKLDLPVVIHSRDAAEDTMKIMKEHAKDLGGVIHCFSGSKEHAKEYVKMGFYIGIGGVVTFKNGKKLKEVVREIPLSSIVLETDCPYLAPEPFRGKRNDSSYIEYIAKEVAVLKDCTYEEVIEATTKNAKALYRQG